MFSGKAVFIGATAQDIHDEFLTPYDTSSFMPGVMIHANLYNTLTTKKFIEYEHISQFLLVNLFLIFFCTFILVRSSNIVQGVLYSLGVIALYILFSFGLFQYSGTMLEVFPLIVAYVFASLAVYLKKFIEERKSKDQVRAIFSRYISEDVADELIAQGIDSMHLG